MTTVTQWFPFSALPKRIGVYQRKNAFNDVPMYSYWDGKHWRAYDTDLAIARRSSQRSMWTCLDWRGVAK